MTTTAKTEAATKFTGELAEPIYASLPDPGNLLGDGVLLARVRKMDLLAKHYSVELEPGEFRLAYAMACDLVPGFEVRYDDPVARALKLPGAYYGSGTKPKGSGALPEVLNGAALVWLFDAFEKRYPGEKDKALADMIIRCIKPELDSRAHETTRAKLAKTLCNRVSAARNKLPIS